MVPKIRSDPRAIVGLCTDVLSNGQRNAAGDIVTSSAAPLFHRRFDGAPIVPRTIHQQPNGTSLATSAIHWHFDGTSLAHSDWHQW